MKRFYKEYRNWFVAIAVVWLAMLIIFLANTGFSLVKVNKFSNKIRSIENNTITQVNWNNVEARELFKEKLWLEQQLELAKSDSFSIGINLRDSVVQVQLKGTVLFQAKIIRQKPSGFFDGSVKETYLNYFAGITKIDTSSANILKKPIKKVIAPKVGEEVEATKPDTVKTERIHWEFITQSEMKIVINGAMLNSDSLHYDAPFKSDVNRYRFKKVIKNSFSGDFMPTLFLWLNDADAKAIYRALPDNPRCIFRN